MLKTSATVSLPNTLIFFSNFSCEVVGVIGDHWAAEEDPKLQVFNSLMPNPSFSQNVAFWQTPSDWLFVVPSGMRKILGWIRERYNNPIIYITENGKISSSLLAAVADAMVSLLGNDISWKQVKNSIWTICSIDLLLKESKLHYLCFWYLRGDPLKPGVIGLNPITLSAYPLTDTNINMCKYIQSL